METKAEINVTPLVDVVLVLLIIFMVVTPMINDHGIHLPKATNGKRASERDLTKTISLAVDGSVLWEQERVSLEILADRLQDLHERQPESLLFVRADRQLKYGEVCSILDVMSTHGFHNLSLQVEPVTRKRT